MSSPLEDTVPAARQHRSRAASAARCRRASVASRSSASSARASCCSQRGFALAPDVSKDALPYLFNMGQAYRQMGNCKEAAFAFKKFVALKSELPEKQRTWLTELIAQLDACAAQQAAAPPPPR